MIRITAWNLNHRTREKNIPPEAIGCIRLLDAEILILTEFVDGPTRLRFKESLAEMGYKSIRVSRKITKNNQVLIASKTPLITGDLIPPDTTEDAATNFLHQILPNYDLEVVGVRPPTYKSMQLQDYWHHLSSIIARTKDRAIVFIGDLNCDPFLGSSSGAVALKKLCSEGFIIPKPEGLWSYISYNGMRSTRIDHALISPKIRYCKASYITRCGHMILAGPDYEKPVSDHAALVLDLMK